MQPLMLLGSHLETIIVTCKTNVQVYISVHTCEQFKTKDHISDPNKSPRIFSSS